MYGVIRKSCQLSEKMLLKKIKKKPGLSVIINRPLNNWAHAELKLSTLRSVALDVARLKQKHTYREKNI